MRYIKLICLIIGIMGSTAAFAHTKLHSSTPLDKSVLTISPKSISLVFNKAVHLIKFTIKDSKKNQVNTGFVVDKNKVSTFSIPINATLIDGNYFIYWVIIGADGHKVKGELSFMVKNKSSNQ